MGVADARRLRTRDEDLVVLRRAEVAGNQAGLVADARLRDTRWALERVAAEVRAERDRFLHELRPDRERRLGARQPELAIVVEADPDGAHHVGRVADEPAVV